MANKSLILATIFIFYISESHAWLPAYLSPCRGRTDTQDSPVRPSHAPLSRHHSRPFISSYHLNNHAKNKIDSSDDDEDDNADMVESSASTANTKNNKGRIGPLGGRKRKKPLPPEKEKENFLTLWNIPGLILFLLLAKGIFLDGFSANSNFAYYESSVYETRMYNSEGKLETSRKESFRSNIPSLVEQRQQKQQQEQNGYSSTSSLTASPTTDTNAKYRRENILSASDNNDGFEVEVIKDMERMLRTQDIILDGFLR